MENEKSHRGRSLGDKLKRVGAGLCLVGAFGSFGHGCSSFLGTQSDKYLPEGYDKYEKVVEKVEYLRKIKKSSDFLNYNLYYEDFDGMLEKLNDKKEGFENKPEFQKYENEMEQKAGGAIFGYLVTFGFLVGFIMTGDD